jgi:ABC-type polysaccharide/polyol phosphate transport system ATPase subunit
MSSDNTVISVQSLGKRYEIYDRPGDRLKQFILPRASRALGLPIRQHFREFWALNDVSFEVGRGETVGIIGRNGSGKSTLLQMICGTLNPTSGSIWVQGKVAALLELGSGFNPEFTGRENVHMNAALLGLRSDQIESRFDDIVAFADIGDHIEQPVKTYSSGMLVRLAFAVIAHVDADVLVIDEALAVGDAFFTQKCMRFLRSFMQTGTVLFVSHDTASIKNLCDRAIWLDQGRVVASGTPKDVCEQYLEAGRSNEQGSTIRPDQPLNLAKRPAGVRIQSGCSFIRNRTCPDQGSATAERKRPAHVLDHWRRTCQPSHRYCCPRALAQPDRRVFPQGLPWPDIVWGQHLPDVQRSGHLDRSWGDVPGQLCISDAHPAQWQLQHPGGHRDGHAGRSCAASMDSRRADSQIRIDQRVYRTHGNTDVRNFHPAHRHTGLMSHH